MNNALLYPDSAELSSEEKEIVLKIREGKRIECREALYLYRSASTALLALLASQIRRRRHGINAYYIRNVHIEPGNICTSGCRFCAYHRKPGQEGGFRLTPEEIIHRLEPFRGMINEVHITGGIHPGACLAEYTSLISRLSENFPGLHIKAFSAAEIYALMQVENRTAAEILGQLKDCGLASIPGGGAEIFDETIRAEICPGKVPSESWLEIHACAHLTGLKTNATMLYGHIETYEHRVDHMNRLRKLQDETRGFMAFIPLKFRNRNHEMKEIQEVGLTEDLRNYAVARIFLDNIPHIKAYWPMLGREAALLAMDYGADDFDGTIYETTGIYSVAGSEEESPVLHPSEIIEMVTHAGFIPVERDSLYRSIVTD